MALETPDDLISLPRAAALSGLTVRTVRALASSRRLRIAHDERRHRFTTRRWLHDYLTSRKTPGGQPVPLPAGYESPLRDLSAPHGPVHEKTAPESAAAAYLRARRAALAAASSSVQRHATYLAHLQATLITTTEHGMLGPRRRAQLERWIARAEQRQHSLLEQEARLQHEVEQAALRQR